MKQSERDLEPVLNGREPGCAELGLRQLSGPPACRELSFPGNCRLPPEASSGGAASVECGRGERAPGLPDALRTGGGASSEAPAGDAFVCITVSREPPCVARVPSVWGARGRLQRLSGSPRGGGRRQGRGEGGGVRKTAGAGCRDPPGLEVGPGTCPSAPRCPCDLWPQTGRCAGLAEKCSVRYVFPSLFPRSFLSLSPLPGAEVLGVRVAR